MAVARMLAPGEVLAITSHEVGGVSPFGLPGNIPVHIPPQIDH